MVELTTMEKWKKIDGFNLYEISTLGRVRSNRTGLGRRNPDGTINGWIQKVKNSYSRRCVCLVNQKGRAIKKVHRLVLEAFVGPCPPKMESLHKNGNSLDNRLSNLRWGTHLENVKDSIKHGTNSKPPIRYGEDHHRTTISDEQCEMIRNHNFLRGDQTAFARKFGVSLNCIHRIKNRTSRYNK